ncbi:MAG: endonuclease/exonuclease/phosphatase family protein [Verrucomicrobiae bacterium]|nr:endonuclease/exonuclease/phosphatase family protein [Verrucomicrobiae bacterium]
MIGFNFKKFIFFALIIVLTAQIAICENTFRVATYNLENYVNNPASGRPVKTKIAKEKICENILALKPDVLAIQEIGSLELLMELKTLLKNRGLDFPHYEFVNGWDTNIFVAVLSKFPIVERRSHTNETYLLRGRRLHVSRGFGEIDIQVNSKYRFTIFTCHLKSKRAIAEAAEEEMRVEEAKILREKIEARLAKNPEANILVAGDFNDTKDSISTRTILGRLNAKTGLIDTRPAERNGDNLPPERPGYSPRNVAWTHFYGKEDTYSRIDYILLSRGMAKEWVTNETYVLAVPNWGLASDHRPIVATFIAEDK